ncbi:LCP family protein [Patescibacteria group bacterium]|nr:LCP family protein [Patescibacteria group bacterium]MBU2472568.1 LCP family protein [Patescibacteria group bacterium]
MKKRTKILLTFLILLLVGLFSIFFFKTSFTISKVIDWADKVQIMPFTLPDLPEKNPNRINILLLGGRGADELGDGKLLSDAMILVSIDKNTNKIAMISLPRDLYVQTWCLKEKKKINFAYAYGGLDCAKKTVSYITNQYVDHAISVNFKALTEVIDTLGGIDIYLDQTFEEDFQWSKEGWEENEHWFIKEFDDEERWVFQISEGENHLDGETALYYVRSRYSTDDFDRMARQQQVLMAIKEKAFSLGVLTNPVKIYNLLDLLGKNVRTDMNLTDIKNMINLSLNLDTENIKTRIFNISPEGLLYHTFINEEYVLLPVGDDFKQIQEVCNNIFN